MKFYNATIVKKHMWTLHAHKINKAWRLKSDFCLSDFSLMPILWLLYCKWRQLKIAYLSFCDVVKKRCLKFLPAFTSIFKYIVAMIDMARNRTTYEILISKIERNLSEIALWFVRNNQIPVVTTHLSRWWKKKNYAKIRSTIKT